MADLHDAVMMNRSAFPDFTGARVVVWGLGRLGGGVRVVQWLVAQGAHVTVVDRASPAQLADSLKQIAELPVTLRLGGEDPDVLIACDLVVVNPAVVKNRSAFFQAVQQSGTAWTTEINLFMERCPARVVGVTGSYGKSTTCAMLAHILCRAFPDERVWLGGNIGQSLLPDVHAMSPRDWVVLELSSAQLEDLPRVAVAAEIAVITNLHEHHLDRHGCFDAYVRAKANIIGTTQRSRELVLGPLTPQARAALTAVVGDTRSIWRDVQPPWREFELRVCGRHNQINARVAAAAAAACGVGEAVSRAALAEFEGLPHRLQRVRTLDGIDYVNDSKATSPQGTQTALEALDQPVVAIVGGAPIDEDVTNCVQALAQRCRAVACLGATGARIHEELARGKTAPGIAVSCAATLCEALDWARRQARQGDVVLFSPGATSFDRYDNFEARGRHFVELVSTLSPMP